MSTGAGEHLLWAVHAARAPSEDPGSCRSRVPASSRAAHHGGASGGRRPRGHRARDPRRPEHQPRRGRRARRGRGALRVPGVPQAAERRQHDVGSARTTDGCGVSEASRGSRRAGGTAGFSHERRPAPHQRRRLRDGVVASPQACAEGVRREGVGSRERRRPREMAAEHRDRRPPDAASRGVTPAYRR